MRRSSNNLSMPPPLRRGRSPAPSSPVQELTAWEYFFGFSPPLPQPHLPFERESFLITPQLIPTFPVDLQTPVREFSRPAQDEQIKVLKKMKKVIYNPANPLRFSRRLKLYYREENRQSSLDKAKQRDGVDEKCAVCLENFKPGELVTLMPCDHMFHEDCIVPWVKNHGKCPVCRFELYT